MSDQQQPTYDELKEKLDKAKEAYYALYTLYSHVIDDLIELKKHNLGIEQQRRLERVVNPLEIFR